MAILLMVGVFAWALGTIVEEVRRERAFRRRHQLLQPVRETDAEAGSSSWAGHTARGSRADRG